MRERQKPLSCQPVRALWVFSIQKTIAGQARFGASGADRGGRGSVPDGSLGIRVNRKRRRVSRVLSLWAIHGARPEEWEFEAFYGVDCM